MTGGRARLFVALELPGPVRKALAGWAARHLAGADELRLIAPANLHVTLCFLGWRDEAEIDGLGRLVTACAEPVAGLSLGPRAWLPPRRPRVLAIDLTDEGGSLTALQAHVARRLAMESGYEPESRPYRPHVTVARVRSGARLSAGRRQLPEPLPGSRFEGEALTLLRSRLAREGAAYEPLARAGLRQVGGRPARPG